MPYQNYNITKNFKLHEFLVTNTGAPNEPTPEVVKNIEALAKKLQKFRDKVGAITIVSGYRSPEVQAALTRSGNVQVSKTSLHLTGKAVDIIFTSMSALKAFSALYTDPNLNSLFGEIALKPTLIHISDLAPEKGITNPKWMEVDTWGRYLSISNVNNFLKSKGINIGAFLESKGINVPVLKESIKASVSSPLGKGAIISLIGLLSFGGFLLFKRK